MKNNKKLGYLIVLLALWGGVTLFQWTEFSDSGGQGTSLHTEAGQPQAVGLSINELKLEKQFPNARQTVKLSDPRNIFAPLGTSSTQIVKKQPASSQPDPISQTARTIPVAPPPGPSPAELAAQRARQELNQFRFLGFLTRGGESQAFLTNGQAIYIVKQGEMLEGKVQVHKIEPDTVTLSTKVWETGNIIQASIPLTPGTNG